MDYPEAMPQPGNKIYIPLPEDEALLGLFKVKQTEDNSRLGANSTGCKKSPNKARKQRS